MGHAPRQVPLIFHGMPFDGVRITEDPYIGGEKIVSKIYKWQFNWKTVFVSYVIPYFDVQTVAFCIR